MTDSVDWKHAADESYFSSHETPRVNCLRSFSLASSRMLMSGGDTDEFRIFDSKLSPIISINGLSRSTFNCHVNSRGDVILLGGGDGVVRVFRLTVLG